MLEDIGLEGGKIPDDHRLELDLLQAIRLALIMRIFILAAQLPRFTPTNDVSHDQIFRSGAGAGDPRGRRLSCARRSRGAPSGRRRCGGVRGAGDLPAARASTTTRASRRRSSSRMEEAYEFVREIGTGISHHWGAFG